jgi:hypothetical protein
MTAPRLDANRSVNTAARRVAYPLSFNNNESLAAVPASEAGGAFIEDALAIPSMFFRAAHH